MAKIYSKSALYFLNACYTREKAITPAQKEKLDASAKCNTEFNKWQGYDNEVWARECTAPPNGGGVKWLVGYIIAGICMLICYFMRVCVYMCVCVCVCGFWCVYVCV